MKRRMWIVPALLAALLLTTGLASAEQGAQGKVTGSINLEPQYWGDYFRVWLEFNVHQEDPSTHEASGMITGRVYNPTLGWKRLWFQAECVSFGEVGGKPSAILVATITRREGWDDTYMPGEPGEHLKWQVVDGGTPGANGDTWSLQWYDFANWVEYWPANPVPECANFVATETLPIDHGDLVIHK